MNDIVNFNTDLSYFKNIIPMTTQAANLFFMKSELMLQDKIYDIFDTEKEEKQIFQIQNRYEYLQAITRDIPLQYREYIKIYLRSGN